jgi:hypothetical protein
VVDEMDSGKVPGHEDDLLRDDVFFRVLGRAEHGYWKATVEGIPCTTFSVARFKPGGAPVVRRHGKSQSRGLRGEAFERLPAASKLEAEQANELAWRAAAIAAAVQRSGGVFIVENPVDRNGPIAEELGLSFQMPEHVSLWQLAEMRELQSLTGGELVHFPQCALGGRAQKWTTLMYSPAVRGLAALGALRCTHSKAEHQRSVGRGEGGKYVTAEFAAYPPALNEAIAEALDAAVPRESAREVSAEQATLSRVGRTFAKGEACVWVPAEAEDTTYGKPCTITHVHYDDGEPYYTVQFADGGERDTVGERLRGVPVVGSARPHAPDAEAAEARSTSHTAASMSLRRTEPELESVLLDEKLPDVNVPPQTEWFDVEPDVGAPGPLSTDELMPVEAQRKVVAHLRQVQACYERAERSEHGWRVARDMRPAPLEMTEEEAMRPAGRGRSWHRAKGGLWWPLTRSRWPDDPPESDLDVRAVLRAAEADVARFGADDEGFPDRYVLACMAHGYPAPELERAVVLGYPHVGALKSMEGLRKCLAKDRKQGGSGEALPWTEHGGAMPQVWPMRADPINVVWRNGKPRITIDKSMELSTRFESYNSAVALEEFNPVEMVRIEQLCRAIAIFLSAGVGVRMWSFDLEAYFRKTGKQRADWWKSGYVLPDGYGFDKRVQFGQREAPVLTSRQSNFLVWAMRREIAAFDAAHPPTDAGLLAWRLLRCLLSTGECSWVFDPLMCLHFVMQFVDDIGACAPDDLLYARDGAPYYMRWCALTERHVACAADAEGAAHARRPDAHYAIALSTIEGFGHSSAAGKGVPPCLNMDLLGANVDIPSGRRTLAAGKREKYAEDIGALLAAPAMAAGGLRAPFGDFNSVVHKLLHASATVLLGRQHLHRCMQARKAANHLAGSYVILHEPQVAELRWWLLQLAEPERHSLPLASRVVFPDVASAGLVCGYSDAAREIASPHLSGFGAWTVIGDVLYWLGGLWEEWELSAFSINVLELAAENMGTFAFIAQARALGFDVTHSLDFVDNTAAEYSADRGTPRAAGMQELVRRRFAALDELEVYSSVERITSIDNEWADALSRGEERVQDVLRMARALGLRTHRLQPAPEWRSLSGLPRLDA